MFERYTQKARRAIFFARYEASQFGSPVIETEHILLGIAREDAPLLERTLGDFFASSDIAHHIRRLSPASRPPIPSNEDLPLSEDNQRVLGFAAEEADRLQHRHIGTEHLLLGLLRHSACGAACLLRDRGLELEKTRQDILAWKTSVRDHTAFTEHLAEQLAGVNPPSPFDQPLAEAARHALAFLNNVADNSVDATSTLHDLRTRLHVPLAEAGLPAGHVVSELVRGVEGGIVGSAGPRFFGFVIGGSLPAALAADWLTSAWDQNAGLYACSPAAAVVEEAVGDWLKQLLHVPPEAGFALVTGCQMAHATALAAARHSVLARMGWDAEAQGLQGAPPIRVLTSNEMHVTVARSTRLLGLGTACIQLLPSNDAGQLTAEVLSAALQSASDAPTIVVLQAGDLNRGAFDDFATLIPIAHEHNAWVHIDGAFGLWCAASPRYAHLLAGAELADSWSTDGHKWLNVPYDCGYAFVRDAVAHRAAMAATSSYLVQGLAGRDQVDWTPEFSRRGRGFATYAALRQLGRSGVADLVDRCCAHARALVTRIGALQGAQILAEPQINQGMVRFLHPSLSATPAQHDHFTDSVMASIRKSGEAFFTGTTWRGVRAMRVSVSNWQTTEHDVNLTVAAVGRVLADCRSAHLEA